MCFLLPLMREICTVVRPVDLGQRFALHFPRCPILLLNPHMVKDVKNAA